MEKHTDNEIMELLSEFRSCDCPYLFEGTIFMAYGDNVSSHAKLLEESLPSFDSFQTWT